MKSYIRCYDKNNNLIGEYYAPFDIKVNCHTVNVFGNDLCEMRILGKCEDIWFKTDNFNKVDLNGFIGLEIGEVLFYERIGLLKILELNCKEVRCNNKKLEDIVNKYVSEEPDPLMRDIQGCKYELAINGYGDRL